MSALKPVLYSAENEGWQRHTTASQPIPDETVVEVWFAFGRSKFTYAASKLNWTGFNDETRIKGYRVVGDGR